MAQDDAFGTIQCYLLSHYFNSFFLKLLLLVGVQHPVMLLEN